jgi:hypothetical protein
MRSAIRITVSTFGVIAGLAGIEHGIGEIAQGNKVPDRMAIESWPDSELFDIYNGEPAFTIVPNMVTTGLLAILVSLALIAWSALFIERRHGGLVLIGLSVALFLVGGGGGPPLLGLVLGAAATRIGTPLAWWRRRLSLGARHALAVLWPGTYVTAVVAWLLLMPGAMIIDAALDPRDPGLLVGALGLAAIAALGVAIVTAFAREIVEHPEAHEMHTTMVTAAG